MPTARRGSISWRLGSRDRPSVVACSALRRIYRDRLRAEAPDLALVYLHGTRELLAGRMAERPGHFMPTSLLDSQLATLEPPTPDENAIAVDVVLTPAEIVASAVKWLRDGTSTGPIIRSRR